MESDEFDDDIADEDFFSAFDQATTSQQKPCLGVKHFANSKDAGDELEETSARASVSADPISARLASVSVPQHASRPTHRTGFNRSSSGVFRQMTLWGDEVTPEIPSQNQSATGRVYRQERALEEPSHHDLNREAMRTWVYPTNLGAIRGYQFTIVKNSLFNNTLVALPTGLGKTFIAATVMLNFHRWTKSAKIVFVAPTKPLVAQQVDACYNVAGIPRSETTLLTGDIPPAIRADEWEARRVFFMTPQTLLNDLSHGYADPKKIVLLVVDEAHRAVGEYAYAKVCKLIRRFSRSIRVLALTATPGSKLETVQEVIDNLGISHCEIRTEDSIDIRQYVHHRDIEQVVLDPSDEMNLISDLFTRALKPMVDKLSSQNIWYGRNPMALTAYGLLQAQKEWFATRGRNAGQGVQFMMRAIFSVLTGLAHSIKLLNFHGIKPFYENLRDMRDEQEGRGDKGSKYKRQLIEDRNFQEMMSKISGWLRADGFVGHPKLTALTECVLNHFMDKGEATRVIVFSEYRDSAEEITRTLNTHKPLVKASVFVGQADGKRGEGMKQKQQMETIERFKSGDVNVLVATSIGEEGLDIGQVDLIVCYDASASPIRMLQRMGRTGRKRAGHIVLLLMRGKEEEQFAKSKDQYAQMQKLICEGSRFNFRFDLSTRIIPRDIRPEVDKRQVAIPVENTQNLSLPEPGKRRECRGKKKPAKKFHMPTGVETGFRTVADMIRPQSNVGKAPQHERNPELDDLADVPPLEKVVLSHDQLKELNRSYRDLPFSHSVVEETDMPTMMAYPVLQRQLRPIVHVKHGQHTKRCVTLFKKIGADPDSLGRPYQEKDTSNYLEVRVPPFADSDSETGLGGKRTGQSRKRRATATVDDGQSDMTQEHRSRRRRRGDTASSSADLFERWIEAAEEEVDEEKDVNDSGEIGPVESPKPQRGRGRPRNSTIQGRGGVNEEEIGDDCERDSDIFETDEEDDGEDLIGFVVGSDDRCGSSVRVQPSTPPTMSSQMTPVAQKEQLYYVPTNFAATQDSEGMPAIESLARWKKEAGQNGSDDGAEDGDIPRPAIGRGRRAVIESDSDE